MAIQKVHQGDRLKIRAQDWNEIASHVNGAVRVPSERSGRGRQLATIYNATGSDLTKGSLVKLTGTTAYSRRQSPGAARMTSFPQSRRNP